jgi:hypothetical protein
MKGGRQLSDWNLFVKKILEEGREKDPNYGFGQALKDASKRKGEMDNNSSSSSLNSGKSKKSSKKVKKSRKNGKKGTKKGKKTISGGRTRKNI